jgi:hypothetical protein
MSEPLVFAFHDGRLYTFERAETWSASHFGGPLPYTITGKSFGPKPLHAIVTLGSRHIPALDRPYLSQLPLVYGMHYDGCELEYRVNFSHDIEVLRTVPATSSDNWPYASFPPLLPYMPLRLSDTPRLTSYEEFASRFPNMPETQAAELIVAVPPPATIGLSLWGDGDGDDVTIVFECDLDDRLVSATNRTT